MIDDENSMEMFYAPKQTRDELPGLPRARLGHSRPLLALEIVCRNPMWEYSSVYDEYNI